MRKHDIERECVKWVFGLTGGELADEHWSYAEPSEFGGVYTFGARYWYEGAPEYATEYTRDFDRTYRTLLVWGGGFLPYPAKTLYDGQGEWELVTTFANSGEAECPGMHDDDPRVQKEQCGDGNACVLCEALCLDLAYREAQQNGDDGKHGYIYIGEGYEAVYRLVEALDEMEQR